VLAHAPALRNLPELQDVQVAPVEAVQVAQLAGQLVQLPLLRNLSEMQEVQVGPVGPVQAAQPLGHSEQVLSSTCIRFEGQEQVMGGPLAKTKFVWHFVHILLLHTAQLAVLQAKHYVSLRYRPEGHTHNPATGALSNPLLQVVQVAAFEQDAHPNV